MTDTIEELTTRYDSRKSFYGKAHVIHESNGTILLQSYSTIVASINANKQLKVNGTYSATTLRHIKEFIAQYTNLGSLNKKEIETEYLTTD